MENMAVPQTLKNRLYYPAIPLLGMYPKGLKTGTWRDIYTSMFIIYKSPEVREEVQPKSPSMNE